MGSGEVSGTGDDAVSSRGLIAVVRPGVDGDVAGLLTLAIDAREASLAALERECRHAAFGWAVVTEDQFAARYGA